MQATRNIQLYAICNDTNVKETYKPSHYISKIIHNKEAIKVERKPCGC